MQIGIIGTGTNILKQQLIILATNSTSSEELATLAKTIDDVDILKAVASNTNTDVYTLDMIYDNATEQSIIDIIEENPNFF